MRDKLTVLLVDDSRSVLIRLEQSIAEIEGVDVVGTAPDGAGAESRAEEAFRLGAVQVMSKPMPTAMLEEFFERERAAISEVRTS